MRISPFACGILVLTVFFGVILGFQAAGVWSTSGKVSADGKQVQPSTGDVDTIKGWMTLEQITDTYPVTLEEVISQFGLPDGTLPSAALKDLETDAFSVDDLRTWLQERLLTGIEPVVAPGSAPPVEIPAPAPTLQPASTPVLSSDDVHEPAGLGVEEKQVTAKTTFQDLLDWGVSQEALHRVLGGPLPAFSMRVKDYVTGQGLEFSDIKARLQAEADGL